MKTREARLRQCVLGLKECLLRSQDRNKIDGSFAQSNFRDAEGATRCLDHLPLQTFKFGLLLNRNKRSVTLDINSPRGQEAFRKMARQADVVLENFRAGTMKRLGFDHESLSRANPRLVTCSIAGFAEDGPYPDRPAYDAVGQALSGLMSLFVEPEDPRTLGPTLSDQITGMQACMAVLAALHERERTGKGARVEVTMVEASMALIPDSFTAYTHAGHVMRPESRAAVSLSFAFACSDGKLLAIHVSSMEKFWRALLDAVERPDIGEDPRFRDRMGRIKNYEALVQALRPVFAAKPGTADPTG